MEKTRTTDKTCEWVSVWWKTKNLNKTNVEESALLTYTGLFRELKHLKIKTKLIDEKFPSVMGEYMFLKWKTID